MILVDFSQLAVNSIIGVGNNPTNNYYDTNEQLSKHLIFNKLRLYNQKFSKKFGDMIICLEGRKNWRYETFQYYKHKRKADKETSDVDWDALYVTMEETVQDLINHFPYTVMRVFRTESDDTIAVLARCINEPSVIISSDKDFLQLLALPNVSQYDPRKESFKKLEVTPEEFLIEHCLVGDRSDSIPNILSPDDFFLHADGVRQKSITAKYKEEFLGRLRRKELTEEEVKNFKRNSKLINLAEIPKDIKVAILEEYSNYVIKGDRKTLLNYFIENKFPAFSSCVNEF
jgi:5'-3' exonuclease